MTGKTGNGESRKTLTFHYIKATDFRTIHVDGAIGGPTPQGLLHVSLWAQRPAIPREVVQAITPEGKLGDEISRQGREGITRELQVDAMLTLGAAKEVHQWLGRHIETLESELAKAQSKNDN